MRPVVKGAAPQAKYKPYGDALDDLLAQLGPFCSYCEQTIKHAPEIEHVQPKFLVPDKEYTWDNFLLACKSCNTIKSANPVDLDQIAFPDVDNTFRGLDFHPDGRVEVADVLGTVETELMKAAVKLVKLHRHESAPSFEDRPTKRDDRVKFRLDVWNLAPLMLDRYLKEPETADLICDIIAPSYGFFSIWMTVFNDHPVMLNGFINAFPGTHAASFDKAGNAIRRIGGRF